MGRCLPAKLPICCSRKEKVTHSTWSLRKCCFWPETTRLRAAQTVSVEATTGDTCARRFKRTMLGASLDTTSLVSLPASSASPASHLPLLLLLAVCLPALCPRENATLWSGQPTWKSGPRAFKAGSPWTLTLKNSTVECKASQTGRVTLLTKLFCEVRAPDKGGT